MHLLTDINKYLRRDIKQRFKKPESLKIHYFKNSENRNIRYCIATPSENKPRATIVMVQGLRQSAEEYFETVNDMLDRNFKVYVMDWDGQGGSDRYNPDKPEIIHSNGYSEQLKTLDSFVKEVIKPEGESLFLFGHSMGGHLALRYLKEYEHNFTSCVLTSPMMDIITAPFPKSAARKLSQKFNQRARLSKKLVFGEKLWENKKYNFKDNILTSSPERYDLIYCLYESNREIRMGPITFGWLAETFNSIDVLNNPNYLGRIITPILMQTSGDDQKVDKKAQFNAMEALPFCESVHIPKAQHEIWMEHDILRNKWLEELDRHLNKFLKPIEEPKPEKLLNKIVNRVKNFKI